MAEPAPVAADPDALGFEHIGYTRDAQTGVATVTIRRPEVLNALDFPTMRELSRAFEQALWDDGVAVLVVTGEGDRAFCTGADLDEQAVKSYALANAPAYQHPRQVIFIDEMPLAGTNKIDKRVLAQHLAKQIPTGGES